MFFIIPKLFYELRLIKIANPFQVFFFFCEFFFFSLFVSLLFLHFISSLRLLGSVLLGSRDSNFFTSLKYFLLRFLFDYS